jgi:ankyrin repeat protein
MMLCYSRRMKNHICYTIYLISLLFIAFPLRASADPLSEALIYHTYFSGPTEVKRLLDKGADANSTDSHGWTALAIASDRNDNNARFFYKKAQIQTAPKNATIPSSMP